MEESQYRELFSTLGIEVGNIGKVLRYRGIPKRVYFNRTRVVGIYFSAHMDDEAWYPSNLWDKIDPYLLKKADQDRLNVVPKPSMEASAFGSLASNWRIQ